jgi:predicted AAA+ superfamily ATPase
VAPAELAALAPLFRPLMPEFRRYLLVGGFPETARQEDIDLSQRLLREDVVERVLKRDMTAFFRVRNVEDLERLFIYICLNSGGILAVQTCAAALGVPNSTVSNYLAALEQANLIYRVESALVRGKKMLKTRHKVYLVDAALRNAVLLRGQDILENAEEMGAIVETTVLRHLYAYHYRDNPKIVYWRDPARNKEVDIIVQSPAYTIPVEVKYREDARISAQDGIPVYCAQEQVKRAYWVTRREEDFDFQDFPETSLRVLRIPAHIFTYLLGQAETLLWPGVHDDSV